MFFKFIKDKINAQRMDITDLTPGFLMRVAIVLDLAKVICNIFVLVYIGMILLGQVPGVRSVFGFLIFRPEILAAAGILLAASMLFGELSKLAARRAS